MYVQLTECRVTKKTDAGLDVVLGASNMAAFLPKMHLSDFIDHCSLLHQSYAENDLITDVVYIGKTNTLALSHKQSLIDAAKKQEFVEKFDDLKVTYVSVLLEIRNENIMNVTVKMYAVCLLNQLVLF